MSKLLDGLFIKLFVVLVILLVLLLVINDKEKDSISMDEYIRTKEKCLNIGKFLNGSNIKFYHRKDHLENSYYCSFYLKKIKWVSINAEEFNSMERLINLTREAK